MAQTLVTPETMVTLAGGIEGKIGDWNTAVNSIYRLAAEMDAMWDGDANDAFNAQFADDKVKFQKLSTVMTDYTTAIKTAAKNYTAGEAEAKTIVTRR